MAYRDSFTDQEWQTIQYAHFWVFQAVAGADNKIDTEERIALNNVMKNTEKYPSLLAREIMMGIEFNLDKITDEFMEDKRQVAEGLRQVADLLDKYLDKDVSILFKKTLIAIGVYVGHSSGKWFSSNFSTEEVEALKDAGLYLKISEVELMTPPQLDEIIQALDD